MNREPESKPASRAAAMSSPSPILALPLDNEQIRRFVATDDKESFMAFQADLEFSDQDIEDAKVNCARRFLSIQPYSADVTPSDLPANSSIFLDGIAAELYELQYRRLSRRDIDFSAGNMNANLVSKRISHLLNLIQTHRSRFEKDAFNFKRAKNRNRMWRVH
jgi:hypothetical protein